MLHSSSPRRTSAAASGTRPRGETSRSATHDRPRGGRARSVDGAALQMSLADVIQRASSAWCARRNRRSGFDVKRVCLVCVAPSRHLRETPGCAGTLSQKNRGKEQHAPPKLNAPKLDAQATVRSAPRRTPSPASQVRFHPRRSWRAPRRPPSAQDSSVFSSFKGSFLAAQGLGV